MKVLIPLLLMSSLAVMMDFEELMKTAISAFHSQVTLRNSNKCYFIVYFSVIEQMTCLVIEQIEYRANDV